MPLALPESARLSRRTLLQGLGRVALGTAAGAAAHGYLYERHHIELTEQTLDVAGWPSSLAGLRIGFLTDLHRSTTVSAPDDRQRRSTSSWPTSPTSSSLAATT